MTLARLVLLAFALVALPGAFAQPQEGAMVHVAKDKDTGAYSYVPERVEVFAGTPVELMIFGDAQHSMTSDDGLFDADVRSTGSVASKTFAAPDAAGSYAFHCKHHPEMKGVLVVSARDAAPTSAAAPAAGAPAPESPTPEAPDEAREVPLPGVVALLALLALVAFGRRRA